MSQLEETVRQRLNEKPNDLDLRYRLGNVYRQQGKLERACEEIRQLRTLQPDHHDAAWIESILSMQELGIQSPSERNQPAPFVQIPNFLPDEICSSIWQIISEHEEQFSNSLVYDPLEEGDLRSSHVLYETQLGSIKEAFLEQIHSTLQTLFPHLGHHPFTPTRTELQLTMHLDGDYFTLHRDRGSVGKAIGRNVTFVYYFHSEPRRFTGGDLLLFDSAEKINFPGKNYTRVFPTNNSVIFFPSWAFHQVTPLHIETDCYKDGRFTLNGWIHGEEL
ncbi:MAG: 2OG-Fe(II) oxygenase [Chloroflexota bacterium]